MKSILKGIKTFISEQRKDIILVVTVVLISLLSFAGGYITCSIQQKEPLIIEKMGE